MAIFNWHIESHRKGGATSQSDYIWRRGVFVEEHDLLATGHGNLPTWCHDEPRAFFEAADQYERRNGSACRHLTISLPRELGLSDWKSVVETLIARDIPGKPYQYAIHIRYNEEGEHPHAHIVYSDRRADGVDRPPDLLFCRPNATSPEQGGCRKDSGGKSPKQLRIGVVTRKKLWADVLNEALGAAGHTARVDHSAGESTPV